MNNYDVIVVGAGSVGVPTAWALGSAGVKTLVLDARPSAGQGENKHAIGGIRATHSDPAKIMTCLRSIEIFATWKEKFGDDIEWLRGGYTFPVYRPEEEKLLKSFLPVQHQHNLNIAWEPPETIQEVVPGINTKNLIGGTYSPDDGSASPLLAVNAFYRRALDVGVKFSFHTQVREIVTKKNRVIAVETDKHRYTAPVIIDAAGAASPRLTATAGGRLPVVSESHEAGITEPVRSFFSTMVVDLRPTSGSKNYYFYQSLHGQIVFCITPEPPIIGEDYRETSRFLPQVCRRMVDLLPRLCNIRVRRVWRGLYPMTPDGSPLVGWNSQIDGLLHAAGMCGQGFMLGPGLGELIARIVLEKTTADDRVVLDSFSPARDFGKMEALK